MKRNIREFIKLMKRSIWEFIKLIKHQILIKYYLFIKINETRIFDNYKTLKVKINKTRIFNNYKVFKVKLTKYKYLIILLTYKTLI